MFNKRIGKISILAAIALASLTACRTTTPIPASTVVPSTATTGAATSAPAPADEWSRIQAAGRIVVGTAPDYAPFAYYDGAFQLDGFDIALMREIGRCLGVQVEFSDFAFDGLIGALQLEQIDVAIAAISTTPERQAVVAFSTVYYTGEDAFLAHQDSTVSTRSVADVTSQRIGVEHGTVHETWLENNLVGTGQMPSGNLFSYARSEDAVKDLREQRVDLVMLDYIPAQSFVNAGGVKIVGRGFNQQLYAIAMRQGATMLKTEIDRALTQLHDEGRIAELARAYLDLEPAEILPTPTPTPVPTAAPTPAPTPPCIDGMDIVQHLTYDDHDVTAPPQVAGDQPFAKGWRVRNTGTCPWDNTYSIVYVQGNVPAARMSGEPVAIARTVPGGDTYDVQVNLVAPPTPGIYVAFWQMRNGQNVAFGRTLQVGIAVPAEPTATPAPTQTPSSGIDFSADRTYVKTGERVVFTWNVVNVQAVYFYAQGEPWEKNGVIGQGKREVYPQSTTIYELRVVKRDDSVEVRQIRVEVEPVVDAPVIAQFTVEPEFQIQVGQCVNIQWQVRGNVSQVKITSNNVALWDGAPLSGSLWNCPPGAGNVAYAIEASGPDGTNRSQKSVNVTQPTP